MMYDNYHYRLQEIITISMKYMDNLRTSYFISSYIVGKTYVYGCGNIYCTVVTTYIEPKSDALGSDVLSHKSAVKDY